MGSRCAALFVEPDAAVVSWPLSGLLWAVVWVFGHIGPPCSPAEVCRRAAGSSLSLQEVAGLSTAPDTQPLATSCPALLHFSQPFGRNRSLVMEMGANNRSHARFDVNGSIVVTFPIPICHFPFC